MVKVFPDCLDAQDSTVSGLFAALLAIQAHTTLEDLGSSASVESISKKVDNVRMNIARRALAELKRGDVVNLGIGIPTLVANLITPGDGIIMHTENGMLGGGPRPRWEGRWSTRSTRAKSPSLHCQGAVTLTARTPLR